MNAQKFLESLRTIIREEVRVAVRVELEQLIKENVKTQPVIQESPKRVERQQPSSVVSTMKKKYSSNPIINDILNETTLTNDFEDWPTMQYSNGHMAPSMPATENIPHAKLPKTPLGQATEKALTRDYTALVKAMNKKG